VGWYLAENDSHQLRVIRSATMKGNCVTTQQSLITDVNTADK
jgi:hypothetical protein